MYKNTDKINYKLHHFFYAFFIFTEIYAEIYAYKKKMYKKSTVCTALFSFYIS